MTTIDELAGKAAYARFRWTTDNGMTPYIFVVRKYAYIIYFIVTVATMVGFIYRGYLTIRDAAIITVAMCIVPVLLPLIQWIIYKIGLLMLGLVGGKVSPHMRDKYPMWFY
jgi:hypothetical protein